MPTYQQLFFNKFANARGNIKKGTKAREVWASIEEFVRIILMQMEEKQKLEQEAKDIPVTVKWSRKGQCPSCGAKTGCNHKKGCIYKKEEEK